MRCCLLVSLTACSPFTAGVGPSDEGRDGFVREPGVVRVGTWNLESAGFPGSPQYDDALAVLAALDADALAINEIQGDADEDDFRQLAEDAGYPHVVIGFDVGFGDDRNAVMSRIPFVDAAVLDAPTLSGDPQAHDITRSFPAATLDTPTPLLLVASHLKSGNFELEQRFRRAVDGQRLAQVVTHLRDGFDPSQDAVLVTGDFNAQIGDWDGPGTWTSPPAGMPGSFWLGSDLYGALQDGGIPGSAFAPLQDLGLDVLSPRQPGGSLVTRPSSGRRLDHLVASAATRPVASGIFTCPGDRATCTGAADHFPVWVDLDLGVATAPEPGAPGSVVITELLANPDACPDVDGEWVELHNPGDSAVDLAGHDLVDAAGNRAALTGVLPAGGFALLGPGRCGPAMDVSVDGVSLNNGGDTLTIEAGGVGLSSVTYTGAGSAAGQSWQSDGGAWCAGPGTPGAPNTSCP